jgi:4-hydroxy-2-oxoheptanedioate aldolase
VTARSIKERLKSGEKVLAAWVYSLSPVMVEAMVIGGYSALMIDQEHGPVELQTVHMLTLAAEARGAQAMVRVPSHDPFHVKRLLDMGIDTIMFPMVDSVADAEAVVAGCYYPPRGRRGLATGGIRATRYGADAKGYFDSIPNRQMLMAQIETKGGLESVEKIAAVDGIDMLFIGPNDLSTSLGHLGQGDHPTVRTAIERIIAAAKASGKWLGTVPTKERDAKTLFGLGFDLVISGADVALLRDAAATHTKAQSPS